MRGKKSHGFKFLGVLLAGLLFFAGCVEEGPNREPTNWNLLYNYPAPCSGDNNFLFGLGDDVNCGSVTIPAGGGGSYTSGSPATIQVDNDANTITQDFDGNFNSRAAGLFPVDYDANVSGKPHIPTEGEIDANALAVVNTLDLNESLSYIKAPYPLQNAYDLNNLLDANNTTSINGNNIAFGIFLAANSAYFRLYDVRDLGNYWSVSNNATTGPYVEYYSTQVNVEYNDNTTDFGHGLYSEDSTEDYIYWTDTGGIGWQIISGEHFYPTSDSDVLFGKPALKWGVGQFSDINATQDVNGARFCIAGDCRTVWPSGSSVDLNAYMTQATFDANLATRFRIDDSNLTLPTVWSAIDGNASIDTNYLTAGSVFDAYWLSLLDARDLNNSLDYLKSTNLSSNRVPYFDGSELQDSPISSNGSDTNILGDLFPAGEIRLSDNPASVFLRDTGGGANAKQWLLRADDSNLLIAPQNDSGVGSGSQFVITRSGGAGNTIGKLQVGEFNNPFFAVDIENSQTTLQGNEFRLQQNHNDNSQKIFKLTSEHYDIDEEPLGLITSNVSSGNTSIIYIGGGAGVGGINAANNIRLYTAPNNTTLQGTQAIRITGDQDIIIGTGATARDRLDIDQNVIIDGELKGTKSLIPLSSIVMTVDGSEIFFIVTGLGQVMDNAKGFTAIRDGSITGMSINYDITSVSLTPDLRMRAKVNGITVWEEVLENPATTGNNKEAFFVQNRGTDSFSAGDTLSFSLFEDDSDEVVVEDIIVLIEIYEDT